MPARSLKATIAKDLHEEIFALATSTGAFLEPESFDIRRLLREADNLQGVNAVEGSVAKANIYALTGHIDLVDRWLSNARANGGNGTCLLASYCARFNLGFFSEAHELYPAALRTVAGSIAHPGLGGVNCAAFSAVIEAYAEVERLKMSELETEAFAMAAEIAKEANALLKRLGATEADVTAILDVAGEVLREAKVFFVGNLSQVTVVDRPQDAGLLVELTVPCDAVTANVMTERVLERIVDSNLDKAGLAFSFLPQLSSE